MRSISLALFSTAVQLTNAIDIDPNSIDSVKNASATLAYALMSYYKNNQTNTPPDQVGVIQVPPLFWWESGACWTGMVDYTTYTGDLSYFQSTTDALLAQTGPDDDYQPPAFYYSLGNDDQAFWGFAALAAAEWGFPAPAANKSTLWSDLVETVFNTQVARWDTTTCGGGMRWQVFSNRSGYDYKNSVSNGALFQISARLARYTGNQTYVEWADKIWDWMSGVGLIDQNYNVFDGTSASGGCKDPNPSIWSYNPSMILYGAAVMADVDQRNAEKWRARSTGLLTAVINTFTSPFPNATDIMYEPICEPSRRCNYDQLSFKAYLARWLSKTAIMAPQFRQTIEPVLKTSAQAAAAACSGGQSGTECGMRWYVGGFDGGVDGVPPIGQQLSALETVQSLLLLHANRLPNKSPLIYNH